MSDWRSHILLNGLEDFFDLKIHHHFKRWDIKGSIPQPHSLFLIQQSSTTCMTSVKCHTKISIEEETSEEMYSSESLQRRVRKGICNVTPNMVRCSWNRQGNTRQGQSREGTGRQWIRQKKARKKAKRIGKDYASYNLQRSWRVSWDWARVRKQ